MKQNIVTPYGAGKKRLTGGRQEAGSERAGRAAI